MRGHIEHIRALVKRVLGAVAVVDVVVQDGDALGPPGPHQPRRGNSDVVEHAKAHGLVRRGVMAWRADQAQRVVHVPVANSRRGLDQGTRRAERRFPRTAGDDGVGVDMAAAPSHEAAHDLDVSRRVDQLERRVVARRRLPYGQLVPCT
jgi:hypothetical protein